MPITYKFNPDKMDMKDPYINLLMNMASGLKYENCSEEEKKMLKEHGYDPENKKE